MNESKHNIQHTHTHTHTQNTHTTHSPLDSSREKDFKSSLEKALLTAAEIDTLRGKNPITNKFAGTLVR